MSVLLLNAGSSSLKASLVSPSDGRTIAQGLADWAGVVTRVRFTGPDGTERSDEVRWKGHAAAVNGFLIGLQKFLPGVCPDSLGVTAVGHRFVHGGTFTSSVRITPDVRLRLASLAALAPLHNPSSLETLAAAETDLPDIPHIAVFDTAFHASIPPHAATYPIPERWTREWGIRRYGFHGLSHAYCAQRAAEILQGKIEELRIVICHLGHGCSASAVLHGRCVDTTMGFTPLEGLMMGTRCGSIDPSIIPYVQTRYGLSPEQVETALNRESGLLGVTGETADMRQVLAGARAGNERCRLAFEMHVHRVRKAIGSLAVTMGGVDAVVFTAGIGEHSREVREAVCSGLECLGLELDKQANAACRPDADVARPESRGRILVVATREDVTMLREVLQVLKNLESATVGTCKKEST